MVISVTALSAVIVVLSALTYSRNNVWRSDIALWQDCVGKSSQKYRPHYNLAFALSNRGQIEEAIEHYQQTLRIEPNYIKAHYNLANTLRKQGRAEEAIEHYLQALQINPDFVDARVNLGNALYYQGRIDEAAAHFSKALLIKPDDSRIKNNLRIVQMAQRQNQ